MRILSFKTLPVMLLFVSGRQAETAVLTNLPTHVVRVPVAQAQCLAVHPTKPVLYVGRSDKQTDGKGLAVLRLDDAGSVVPDSRRDVSDGIVDLPAPVSEDLQYSIQSITVNPVLPQVHVAAAAKRPRSFKLSTNTCHMASLELGDDGVPTEKVDEYRNAGRNVGIHHLACDTLGRYIYFGESHGYLGFWSTGDEERIRVSKAPSRPKDRSVLKRRTPKSDAHENLVRPFVKITNWTYVPEWKRSYGCDSGSRKVIFTMGEDGRSCSFLLGIATQSRSSNVPQVSVKHQKMYIPNAQGAKLGIYQLTREGRFTSLPRFVPIDPVRQACLDDKNDRLYVVQPKGQLSVYSLDADGNLAGDPQRFDLQAGEVKDMVISPKGVLYLACSAPPGGKP